MQFVLLHSPLVGPTTWRWVDAALRAAGHGAAVPDLRVAAMTGTPETLIPAAIAAIPPEWSTLVVVAHSGAGFFVPSVAERLGKRSERIIFVDAGLPPCEGPATASADFLDQLRTLAVDGVLPRWSTWWGEGVMEVLVPAADRRAELEAEMPEIPLAFYESPLKVPVGWCDTPGSFLLLSEVYRRDAERARALGWPMIERLGGHLDVVNAAEAVAQQLIDLAG
jgi:hypothetical protein